MGVKRMPLGNVHNHPHASILCDCLAHKEARDAHIRAGKIAREMVTKAKAGATIEELDSLCAELEKFNSIARQVEESWWP